MSDSSTDLALLKQDKKPYRLYFVVIVFVYFILVLSGIHSSSVGILGGERINGTTTYYGSAQPIRSDEYLRSTPILLGQLKSENRSPSLTKRTTTTPFDSNYSDNLLSGDISDSQASRLNFHSVYSGILRIDDRVLSLLPLQNEFVARWWLNTLYLFLGLGLFFRALKMSWKYALVCSLLVWLSPPNQWWSLWPVQSVGPAAMAVGLFLGALFFMDERVYVNDQSKRSLCFGVLVPLLASAIFAIRLPGTYQPWSIPTAIFFACLAIGAIWQARISRQILKKIIVPFAALFVVGAIPMFLRLSRSISKSMKTVYPGSRRFTGFTDFPHWSGPASWAFQNVSGAVVNQSEYAIGVLVFVPVVALALTLRSNREHQKKSLWFPTVLGTIPLVIFVLWIIAPWSKGASEFFLLSNFQPERIMQILGVLAPILFVLVVGYWRERIADRTKETNSVLIIGAVVFVLTLQGTTSLRLKFFTNLSVWTIWVTAAITAVAIATTFTHKYWRIGLTLLVVASIFSVANVNPIVRGVGIFGNSAAMEALQSAESLSQGRWASDNYGFDSVTAGGGMRLLSGNQGNGPNLNAYHLLDPMEQHSQIWNRGGSYVFFNWTTGPEIGFVNPGFDIVGIQIDPCNKVLNQFDLSWVVSSNDLSSHTCLRYYVNIIFQGTRFNVYQRTQT